MQPQYERQRIACHRQRALRRAHQVGVAQAAREYAMSRKTLYKWKARYDGTRESLIDRSRAPHHHPAAASPAEIRLVQQLWPKMHMGLDRFHYYLVSKHGYARTKHGLYRLLLRMELLQKKRKHRRKSKPYQPMLYPGQRLQVDVKHIHLLPTRPLYQFTAIDEFSRWRYMSLYDGVSVFHSCRFLEELSQKAPFSIQEIQTDNGSEFTYRCLPHVTAPHPFETRLAQRGIRHKLIAVATPRHNGKVERSHRIDEEEFYRRDIFYSEGYLRRRFQQWRRDYNNRPHGALQWRSPNQTLALHKSSITAVTYV